jgi:hypothetical protein
VSAAVARDVHPSAAPRGRRWLLLAILAAALLVPGTPLIQSLAPIASMGLIVVPALACCAVVAWSLGGKAWLPVVWLALVMVVWLQPAGNRYAVIERGWVLVLVSFFGLISLAGPPSTRFFPRALTAVAGTASLAALLLIGTAGAAQLVSRVTRVELARRPNAALEWVRGITEPTAKGRTAPVRPAATGSVETLGRTLEEVLRTLPEDAMPIYPALLGLESLAALALAWELFHYMSRTRLGEPLRPIREFRFSDRLAWGFIVGATLVVLPTGEPWRTVGLNFVLFFGALYAVRGLGVLVWFLETRRASPSAVVALAVAASLLSAPAAIGLGLLGLGDSWLDWRRTGTAPTSHPAR